MNNTEIMRLEKKKKDLEKAQNSWKAELINEQALRDGHNTNIRRAENSMESLKKEIAIITEELISLKKPALPKTWRGLETINGYLPHLDGYAAPIYGAKTGNTLLPMPIFPSLEQAYAVTALAILSQLKDVYNDGWEPDWKDSYSIKRVIGFARGKVTMENSHTYSYFLTFKTAKIRDEFYNNFKDLIETAKPLL